MKSVDPFYLLLRFVVLKKFIACELREKELDVVTGNIDKHRRVLWVNLFATIFVSWGLVNVPEANLSTIMTALIGPVMVFGGAWFAISFSAVPDRMQTVGNATTFWMFTAFLSSLSTMFIVVGCVSPWQIWPVLAMVFWAGYMSCVQYDTADALKIGLDEKMLLHAIAALEFYKREHQINPGDSKS